MLKTGIDVFFNLAMRGRMVVLINCPCQIPVDGGSFHLMGDA